MMDSSIDTKKHIEEVRNNLFALICELDIRYLQHDKSKLEEPEKSGYDQVDSQLAGLTYGSEEYNKNLEELKPTIEHHYKNNSHHPEYYQRGISGMNLVDIIEMLCDWKAATLRHNDGDIRRSIEINQKRFGYSDELKSILLNTVILLEELENENKNF